MSETRVCGECGAQKPVTEFTRNRHAFRCAMCRRRRAEYMKAWRLRPENYERALLGSRQSFHRRMADPANRAKKNAHQRASRKERWQTDEPFRQRSIAQVQANYATVRATLLAGYGGQCVCCGEREAMFLELDHVNGGGARHYKIASNPVTVYRAIIAAGFPKDYQLLCCNCNRGRNRNGGICPHQQRAT